MIRLRNIYEQLVELFLSSLLILFYGFYIFGTDVAQDLSNSLVELENDEVKENEVKNDAKDDMTPITFVHRFSGFRSFGKWVSLVFFNRCFFRLHKCANRFADSTRTIIFCIFKRLLEITFDKE